MAKGPAATLPDSSTGVERTVLTRLFDCDVRTITSLAERQIIVKVARGRYALVESVRGYVRHLREQAAARGATREGRDPIDSSIAHREAQTRLLQLKAAQVEGRLVSFDAVAEAWEALVLADRQLFLSFPSRARFVLPHLTSSDQAKLTQLAHDMLEEVSAKGAVKGIPSPEGDEAAQEPESE
jgi:phage terminase Nu1 subunit (DNA packaging protein)